jgi:hypothetical protein
VTTTQTFASLAASDKSALGSFSFNGLMYQTGFDSTSGAYYRALATGTDGTGTALTTDSAGGVTEINTALQSFWDNYKLSPDTIWVAGQEAQSINKLVIAGGGAPLFRFNVDGNNGNGSTVGGSGTDSYFNKFTQSLLKIRIHPVSPGRNDALHVEDRSVSAPRVRLRRAHEAAPRLLPGSVADSHASVRVRRLFRRRPAGVLPAGLRRHHEHRAGVIARSR